MVYENKTLSERGKNKANQSQLKPIKANSKPIKANFPDAQNELNIFHNKGL